MLVLVKQAVHLAEMKQGKPQHGKDYMPGLQDIPEAHLKSPHGMRMMQAGLIMEADQLQMVKPLSEQQRAEKLLEKLAAAPKAKMKIEAAAPEAVEDAPLAIAEEASPAPIIAAPVESKKKKK